MLTDVGTSKWDSERGTEHVPCRTAGGPRAQHTRTRGRARGSHARPQSPVLASPAGSPPGALRVPWQLAHGTATHGLTRSHGVFEFLGLILLDGFERKLKNSYRAHDRL